MGIVAIQAGSQYDCLEKRDEHSTHSAAQIFPSVSHTVS